MTFWSGEKLAEELPTLITDYDQKRLDCASYRLRVGSEVYVTPSDDERDWRRRTKTQLDADGRDCVIPPGQFAFLLTMEVVKVPNNAIAFISMRSKDVKFRGLVNVSGFHVDPGYHGRLIFSVFNAGPSAIHVARGDDWFMIFYADLDRVSEEVKTDLGWMDIPSKLINPISDEVWSFEALSSKISDVDKKLGERITAVERDIAVSRWATALLVAALIAFGVRQCAPPPPSSEAPQIERADTTAPPAQTEQAP